MEQENKTVKELQEAAKATKDEALKAAIEKKIKQIKKPFTK
jgi:ferritin-like metal-binding protein YciE